MKTLVISELKANEVVAELAGGRVWSQGALGTGSVPAYPDKPFMLVNFTQSLTYPGFYDETRPERVPVQVYAYQDRGSYTTINRLLIAVRETVLRLTGKSSPSGLYRCSGVAWGGLSTETEDVAYDANMRFATVDLVGTQW